jgi:methionyl-tRNA formyltransferase
MKVLVISDNVVQYRRVKSILDVEQLRLGIEVDYVFSFDSSPLKTHADFQNKKRASLNIKKNVNYLIDNYQLIISVHCKQIFPKELVESIRCINIHPGYNPINRGWYPQVFSIVEGIPIGATIHEMDKELDHGPIIARSFVEKYEHDTSLDIYERVLEKEVELFEKYLDVIVNNNYETSKAENEGVLYLKKDFNDLCQLDLDEKLTLKEAIDRFRALTHGTHKNAYFVNNQGKKVYVSINLELEDEE